MRLSHVCPLLLVFLAAFSGARAERFECLVEPFMEVQIASGVPGILDEVLVERGDTVKNGQVLATLKSNVEQAHYELVKARAEFAARKAERNVELYLKQMISPHEKDELETEAALLVHELREAEERLKNRSMNSTVNGVVVERFMNPGEYVGEEPILRLAQIDPLRVEMALPVRYFGKVTVGMSGRVEFEAPGTSSPTGKVTVVDPVVDAASGTIGVRLELPNPRHRLPAGTKCWVELSIE